MLEVLIVQMLINYHIAGIFCNKKYLRITQLCTQKMQCLNTVHAEISMVCKFHGFCSHLWTQQKFNL